MLLLTTASQLCWRDSDPARANRLPVQLTARALRLFSRGKDHDGETGVLSALNVDHNVALAHLEALKELDDRALVGGPGQTTDLDTAFDVVFVDAVATADVLFLGVEFFKLCVVLHVEVVEKDPPPANLLLLLLLEGSLGILARLEETSGLASLATLFAHLELDGAGHHVVALKKLGNLFLGGLKGQSLQSESSWLLRATLATVERAVSGCTPHSD